MANNPIKWQKTQPEKAIKCHYTSSRINKLEKVQDGILAQKGLTFDQAFTVDTIQFGTSHDKALRDHIAGFPALKKWEKAMIDNGTPAEVAKARIDAIVNSGSVNAGVNEAVRSYAQKQHGLPADFWDSGTPASTPADISTAEVDV